MFLLLEVLLYFIVTTHCTYILQFTAAIVATSIHSEEPIQEQDAHGQVPISYSRRSTRATRAADVSKTQAAEAKKAMELHPAAKKEEKQLEEVRKKDEAAKKKEEIKK
jgi:hypothetical protein